MTEDYIRYFGSLQRQKKKHINAMLFAEGKSLADFPQMEQVIEYDEKIYLYDT